MSISLSEPPATVRSATTTVTIVTDPAALEALYPAWLELQKRSDATAVVLAPMWLMPWWRIWGSRDGRQLRVVLVHDGGRPIGLAPLLRRRYWHRGVVPVRRLEPLGSGEDAGEKVWSDYLNVIAERGTEATVAKAVVDAVVQGRLGAWDDFAMPAMDGEGLMPGLLADAFRRSGARTSVTQVDNCPYIALPATWDAYLKAQTSHRRYLINRSIRDFEKWAGADVRMFAAKSVSDLVEGTRVLQTLHGERWRADGQAGVFCSTRFVAFHAATMREMLRAGALELDWMTVRGEPIAVQYNFKWEGKVSTYQSGRKMDVPKNIRPGLVLHVHAIRRAIETGQREYDFLAGVSRYKMDLAGATRPLVDLRAVRPGLANTASEVLELGVGWTKKIRAAMGNQRAEVSAATPFEKTDDEA